MNRRGFFGRLFGAAAAVTVAKVLPAEADEPDDESLQLRRGESRHVVYDGMHFIVKRNRLGKTFIMRLL